MARMARLVVPGYPHHVTQRGNRRQKTFFSNDDYASYIKLLAATKSKAGVEVWAYCLMPNHIHLVVVPKTESSLADLFSDAHRRYTRRINAREGWKGHLWQERFHSSVMDENYLLSTVRYVELNPVRARLCDQADRWLWSSVHAHLSGRDDQLVTVKPMLERISAWQDYLAFEESQTLLNKIRHHSRTGRPNGDDCFIRKLEKLTSRKLMKAKPGPKIK